MDSGELILLVLEWSMHGIGCQRVLLPQHQSTVSKDVLIDLFASHQKMTTVEPLKKRTIHGHNCLQRSVSDDNDDEDDDDASLYLFPLVTESEPIKFPDTMLSITPVTI